MTNCIQPSIDLAYLLGVRQTDGSVFTYQFKGEKRKRFVLTGCKKSIPMIEKTKLIFEQVFDRHATILKKSLKSQQEGGELFYFEVGIKNIRPEFRRLGLESFQIPKWVAEDPEFFGAYLAGLIDGDGDITVKRPKYPQCRVRITSSEELTELKSLIEKYLGCACYSEHVHCAIKTLPRAKAKEGNYYCLSFVVSPKNAEFLKTRILPNIALTYKKNKVNDFLEANSERLFSKQI